MGGTAILFHALQIMLWLLFLCVGLLDMTVNASVDGKSALAPPQGNSLKLKTKTRGGKYLYKCVNREWIPVLATADLVNISDYRTILGNYSLVYRRRNSEFVGMWYIENDDADFVESGAQTTIVAGNEIASEPAAPSGSLAQILAEATFHKYSGIGSQVSYIQRLNTEGGIPPSLTPCRKNSTTVVPFEAEFWFYTQDTVPPPVPAAIAVPSGRMVEGFFCKGVIAYAFDGSEWQRKKMHGKLFNVPGGYLVGTFEFKSKPDKYGGNFRLEVNNPNGWSVTAKVVGRPVQFADDCLPWSLYKITSSTGNVSLLGPFNYYQMIGTRGGVPPNPSNGTRQGTPWIGVFSNQFWIYTDV